MSIGNLIRERILILDGAMGTMIQKHGLTEDDYRGKLFANHPIDQKGNNDILTLTRPDIIIGIHKAYLEAGADIIETNTFSSNKISMADYGMENKVYELNFQAAHNVAQAISEYESTINSDESAQYHFIAGSMGPTNRSASMSSDVNDPGARAVTFDEQVDSYSEQVRGLIDGGVDLLLVETIFDPINCKAALFAIDKVFEEKNKRLPVMVSCTLADTNGRLLTGQSLEAFLIAVSHFPLFSFGMNCAFGAAQLRPFVEELAAKSPFLVSTHPNAGLPNEFGEYEQSPADMATIVEEFMKNRWVNIIGGCCGTSPDHIKEIAKLAKKYLPRPVKDCQDNNSRVSLPAPDSFSKDNEGIKAIIGSVDNASVLTKLSGLDPLIITAESNFINIGERTNVSGSAKFARLIREEKYDEAIAIARHQVEGGAQIIDVCMDEAMLDSEKSMTRFLNLLMSEPDIARLPIMIDSSQWNVIEAGLKCVQGKSIVNSISLKEGEEIFLSKASTIRKYGAAAVVMLFDEKGQADSYERRIAVAKRSYDLLIDILHFPPEDIIFDPNVLAIATGIAEHDNYAVDFINTTAWIKQNLPYAKISGGISNLSFSFRGINKVREAMHSVFLYHAIKAGLDMGIVNPGMLQVYTDIEPKLLQLTEDVVLNRGEAATEQLIKFAEGLKNDTQKSETANEWRNLPIVERIKYSVIKGFDEFIANDVEEARSLFAKSIGIIDGPLMDGINEVGQLFGNGQMFLPQVVKSARVMKKAVEQLAPHIEAESNEPGNRKAGKILLATVKGDVHDIGKNILSVVLSCNNYEVIDLGVMVPCEKILSTAVEEKVDYIGLSGLITPSLHEMEHVASEMERLGFRIPLLIGGATTSEVHTAVKLAPNYSGLVLYTSDASKAPVVLASLQGEGKEKFVDNLNKRYQYLQDVHNKHNNSRTVLSIEEARANRLKIDWNGEETNTPEELGRFILKNIDIRELEPYINWSNYFIEWGFTGKFPKLLNSGEKAKEVQKLYDDTLVLLDRVIKEDLFSTSAVFGIYKAASKDETIIVYDEDGKELTSFNFQRDLLPKEKNKPNLCLSDFIATADSGIADYMGMFTVSVNTRTGKDEELLKDDYSSLMTKILMNTLAEALTEWLHERIRKEYWGFAKHEELTIEELFNGKYQGIRPAPGYPSCPDHSLKHTIFALLDTTASIGTVLTENFAMIPLSSVSGFIFSHPKARNFRVGGY